MSRFFRSALFPLIVIVLLVYLASQTLIPKQKGAEKVTYSDLITMVQDEPKSIDLVVFNPNKQQITATLADEKGSKLKVNYPTPQSQIEFQNLLEKQDVKFDSKGTGSSAWWSILGTLLPLPLLLLFCAFIID